MVCGGGHDANKVDSSGGGGTDEGGDPYGGDNLVVKNPEYK